MATTTNLEKVHVFPSEESYNTNKTSVGTNDLALVPIGTATTSEYGLTRLASESDVLGENGEAVVNVPLAYELNDFRRMNKAYEVGDKVNCAFRFEFYLECTTAGTTSAETLDTRNVTHGQVITDGTCQWTVRTHVKSINGNVPDANGNITVETDGVKTVNGNEPDENGNITPAQTGCLPLSGGTMTGEIGFNVSGTKIVPFHDQNFKGIDIRSGGTISDGGWIGLYAKDSTNNSGGFNLEANNGIQSSSLIGSPDGTLFWAGSPIADFVVEQWTNGKSWYRKWKSGRFEQSFSVLVTKNCEPYDFDLLIPMSNYWQIQATMDSGVDEPSAVASVYATRASDDKVRVLIDRYPVNQEQCWVFLYISGDGGQ